MKPGGAAAAALAAALAATLAVSGAQPRPRYEVYAVRFAHVPYGLASLVAGAEKGPTVDIAFTVWPIRDAASGRVILVDAGFHRQKFLDSWKPLDHVTPAEALTTSLAIPPAAVTDVILSHSHWDHADGVDLFPTARIWMQKAEFEHYVGPGGEVLARGGVDAVDAPILAEVARAGRLRLVDGDDREIAPGIRVYTGGKHTYESQYVTVATVSGTVVLASDNAYLYRNIEQGVAIAQTLDPAANVAAIARMRTLASRPGLIVPGHDPEVFTRFPRVGPNAVRLDVPR
ncbi:MAG: N-acyl homoserine lactonase family protein [Vicinamibacterales bacterium]